MKDKYIIGNKKEKMSKKESAAKVYVWSSSVSFFPPKKD